MKQMVEDFCSFFRVRFIEIPLAVLVCTPLGEKAYDIYFEWKYRNRRKR